MVKWIAWFGLTIWISLSKWQLMELANEILFWFLCSNCFRKNHNFLLFIYFCLVSESCAFSIKIWVQNWPPRQVYIRLKIHRRVPVYFSKCKSFLTFLHFLGLKTAIGEVKRERSPKLVFWQAIFLFQCPLKKEKTWYLTTDWSIKYLTFALSVELPTGTTDKPLSSSPLISYKMVKSILHT